MSEKGDWIRLLVKYKGKCSECGKEILTGEYALWSGSSKAIKHLKCEKEAPSGGKKLAAPAVMELDCFICGKPAGCAQCSFEADCNRAVVSQVCICSQCIEDRNAYQNYQYAFLEKARKVAKTKIL
jgi:hypothetical protein